MQLIIKNFKKYGQNKFLKIQQQQQKSEKTSNNGISLNPSKHLL